MIECHDYVALAIVLETVFIMAWSNFMVTLGRAWSLSVVAALNKYALFTPERMEN